MLVSLERNECKLAILGVVIITVLGGVTECTGPLGSEEYHIGSYEGETSEGGDCV